VAVCIVESQDAENFIVPMHAEGVWIQMLIISALHALWLQVPEGERTSSIARSADLL